MIKAIIFDVGGVLHTNELLFVHTDIINTLKISKPSLDAGLHKYLDELHQGNITEEDFWEKFIQFTGAKGKLPKESLFLREYKKRFKKNVRLLEVVNKLKNNGYKTAVLTNTIKPHADFLIKQKLYNIFDLQVLSHEIHMIKPSIEIYKYTLDKLHVEPEEAIFVDDTLINVEMAIKIGLKGILFTNTNNLLKTFNSLEIYPD